MTQADRRRTGMISLTFYGDTLPVEALNAFDNTDLDTGSVEDRALFDVELQKGIGPDGRRLCRAQIANAGQFITQAQAIFIDAGIDLGRRNATGKGERPGQVWLEADAFFIHEYCDAQGTAWPEALFL